MNGISVFGPGRVALRRPLAAAVALLLAAEALLPTLLLHARFRRVILLLPMVGFLVVAYWPWAGLTTVLAYGPFAAAVRFAGASTLVSLAKDLLALAVILIWLLRMLVERRRWIRTALDVWLVLFLALLVLQALRAPTLLRGVLGLKVLALYVPIYFLVTNNPPSRVVLRRVLWVLLGVAVVTALYGLRQYAQLRNATDIMVTIEGQSSYVSLRNGEFRVFSTFTHSVVFSLYLALMLTLAAALALAETGWRRLAAAGIGALMLLVLPLTLSRIGWLGAAVGLLVLGILTLRHGRLQVVALTALAVILFFALASPAARDTMSWSFSSRDSSYNDRLSIYYWGHRMVFAEMPQGCGVGTMSDAGDLLSRLTRRAEPSYTCYWNGFPVTSSETMALAFGTQAGALGYILYAILHIVLWREGLRSYARLPAGPFKTTAAGLLAYLAIMTFSNFVSGSSQAFPVVDLYFWTFAGLVMSLERMAAPAAPHAVATLSGDAA